MKRLITAIAAAAMAMSSYAAWRYDLTVTDSNSVRWLLDCEDVGKIVTIHGASYYGTSLDVPAKLTVPDVGECSVTEIDPHAFDVDYDPDAARLVTVTIPSSVTTIYEYAFLGCSKLRSVTLSRNLEMLGEGAFEDCTSLTNVDFCTTYVGKIDMDPYSAFANTPYLARVNANDNFARAKKLLGVAGWVEACNDIATNEQGDNVYLDEYRTLWWKWTAPAGVTDVAFHTFGSEADTTLIVYEGTSSLDDIMIETNSDGKGKLGGHAYVRCGVIPGQTYYICVGSPSSGASSGKIRLGWLAANGFSLYIENGLLLGYVGDNCPENLTIPNSVNFIMHHAFDSRMCIGTEKIKSVTIPGSASFILEDAFFGCKNLSSITFNEGLEFILDSAFAGCTALKSKTLTLPSTVAWVDSSAFADIGGTLKVKAPAPLNEEAVEYGYLASGNIGSTVLIAEYFNVPDNGRTYVRFGLSGGGHFPWPAHTYNELEILCDYAKNIGDYVQWGFRKGLKDWNYAPFIKPTSDKYIFGGFCTLGGVEIVFDQNMKCVCGGGSSYWSEDGKWIYSGTDLDLLAMWLDSSQTHSIAFNANGGTGGKTFASAVEGRSISYYLNQLSPKRDGYEFDGWWTGKTGGKRLQTDSLVLNRDNVTYYAHWKSAAVQTCAITFHASGGTGGKKFASVAVGAKLGTYMDKVSPKYEANGYSYEFDGWWTERSGGKQVFATDVVSGEATYYAHWKIPTCSITFHASGGTGGKKFSSVALGRTLGYYMNQVSPKYEANGYSYTFDGWWTARDGGERVTAETVVTGGKTYYAHWIIPTCTVTFHANGGTGGKKFPSVALGRTLGYYMDQVKPTNGTKTFNGWYTAKTGGTKVSAETVVTGDVTYYARWK